MTADPEPDLAEELDYVAEHIAMFTKAEMAVLMQNAAEAIRDLREIIEEAGIEVHYERQRPAGNA